jgi:hypothetical protein
MTSLDRLRKDFDIPPRFHFEGYPQFGSRKVESDVQSFKQRQGLYEIMRSMDGLILCGVPELERETYQACREDEKRGLLPIYAVGPNTVESGEEDIPETVLNAR